MFGRSYVGEPDAVAKELAADEAIAAADTLLMTIPNTLGVDYNAHVIESVLIYSIAEAIPQTSKALRPSLTLDTPESIPTRIPQAVTQITAMFSAVCEETK